MSGVSRRSVLSGVGALLAEVVGSPGARREPQSAPGLVVGSVGGSVGPTTRFWCATGFSPAELLLLPEMRQALAYLGAVPNGGIKFVRVHYLLDLVTAAPT